MSYRTIISKLNSTDVDLADFLVKGQEQRQSTHREIVSLQVAKISTSIIDIQSMIEAGDYVSAQSHMRFVVENATKAIAYLGRLREHTHIVNELMKAIEK